ncbi:MAG: hypothetical protein ACLT4C_06510 [Butyricicoccus sp.]
MAEKFAARVRSAAITATVQAVSAKRCVHTKVYDSCRSKECLRDICVYLTRDAQERSMPVALHL